MLQRFRDQTLPGFYLTQKNTNDVVDNPNYQPTYGSDKVHNPYRVGLDLTDNTDNQYMFSSDKVLDPHRAGSDLTAQRNIGEFVSLPPILQSNVRSRIEPSNLDFSKSMTQFLGSPGDLNENPREGFCVVAACSNSWRHTMGSHLTSHEDRLSKLE